MPTISPALGDADTNQSTIITGTSTSTTRTSGRRGIDGYDFAAGGWEAHTLLYTSSASSRDSGPTLDLNHASIPS